MLVYAHDVDARAKHETARLVLRELWAEGTGCLSTQVFQEFYVTVTRKLSKTVPSITTRAVVGAYGIWCVNLTPLELEAAFRIEDGSRIGFWDALIVAAAMRAGATTLLSEDLTAGRVISGVRIRNPFATSKS